MTPEGSGKYIFLYHHDYVHVGWLNHVKSPLFAAEIPPFPDEHPLGITSGAAQVPT